MTAWGGGVRALLVGQMLLSTRIVAHVSAARRPVLWMLYKLRSRFTIFPYIYTQSSLSLFVGVSMHHILDLGAVFASAWWKLISIVHRCARGSAVHCCVLHCTLYAYCMHLVKRFMYTADFSDYVSDSGVILVSLLPEPERHLVCKPAFAWNLPLSSSLHTVIVSTRHFGEKPSQKHDILFRVCSSRKLKQRFN